MREKLLIRIRWAPFVLLLVLCVAILYLSVTRSFRQTLVKPAVVLAIPPGQREKPPPVSQAHAGWLAVRAFERMMDSLRQDSRGASIYDSILVARPGILDSAKKAEAFFLSHDH
jgi:hypothetical protein